MKTTALIPVKLNNQRLPNKNLKEFSDGTPLIHFVQKALLKIKKVDKICIYCSDDRIKNFVLEGVDFIKRPQWLDTNEAKSGDIIKSFIETIDSDIYVMAHATSPFIKEETYNAVITKVQTGEYDSAFAAKKLQNFLWFKNKPLNFTLDNAPRTQDMEPAYCELSSPYVFRKEVFEKYGGRTGENPYIHECTEIEAIDIDYLEDFVLADAVYTNILLKNCKEDY